MNEFNRISKELELLIQKWEPILLALPQETLINRRNSQNRNIKQILGHLIDSTSNNTHRVVHLQYQKSPLVFPNYATYGNNDRWISIQNYQEEDWKNLIQLWKYSTLHFCHVIEYVDKEKLNNQWLSSARKKISLQEMVIDFPKHFMLHLKEIKELI
ncbi:MAG: DinB family protein [Salinivirgaceae bacterium]|jgi:hypothetical protein